MNIKERVASWKLEAETNWFVESTDEDMLLVCNELERLWHIEQLAQTAISNMQDDGIPLSHMKGVQELANAVMKKVGE